MSALLAVLLLAALPDAPAGAVARNVVVVVTDGLRPREVFEGAERRLMGSAGGAENEQGLVEKYWRESADERRAALMPFLWGTVVRHGQIFGDAAAGSRAVVTNTRRLSYPGYNELFTGVADPRIRGNEHPANSNVTVLEWLAQQPSVDGRVQAFATWDTFFRIFNVERSHLDVRAGWEPPFANDPARTSAKDTLDAIYRTTTPLFGGNALDAITWAALKESLRTNHPRVLFLGLGETDEWMHAGRYDLSLEAIRRGDAIVADLWNTLQSMPEYAGTTTLIITTDHGRGVRGADWREHGARIAGSEDIWLGIMGPGIPALGERTETGLMTQTQVASTLAAVMGFDWLEAAPTAGKPLPLGAQLSAR